MAFTLQIRQKKLFGKTALEFFIEHGQIKAVFDVNI